MINVLLGKCSKNTKVKEINTVFKIRAFRFDQYEGIINARTPITVEENGEVQ